jgi:hypothetical protein
MTPYTERVQISTVMSARYQRAGAFEGTTVEVKTTDLTEAERIGQPQRSGGKDKYFPLPGNTVNATITIGDSLKAARVFQRGSELEE